LNPAPVPTDQIEQSASRLDAMQHSSGGAHDARRPTVSPLLLTVMSASIAILVTNLYFAQPLILDIAATLHIPAGYAGVVISASQLGYGLGLFLIVPLSDIMENRRLVLVCATIAVAGTIGLATATSAGMFLLCALIVGIFSSGAQILIPYLSHILPEERRGRAIGAVMSGVLTAVMLARPFALIVAATFGWRAIYWISAALTLAIGFVLARAMPRRQPTHRAAFHQTIASMAGMILTERMALRWTAYSAALFAIFTMFWAVIPIVLTQHFHLSHAGIALFALAGAGGALAAPLAGRIADRGLHQIGSIVASLLIALAYFSSIAAVGFLALLPLIGIAITIDGGMQASQTFARLAVLQSPPDRRGRVNALYMTFVYFSGALGSIAGVSLYIAYGWTTVALVGGALACCVVAARVIEVACARHAP
jgi:predicted MFS family arabinose efflux permease